MAKLLFEDGRVQIETQGGCAIWLEEGEAMMVAHLLAERLSVPGDGHVIPACLECGQPAREKMSCGAMLTAIRPRVRSDAD